MAHARKNKPKQSVTNNSSIIVSPESIRQQSAKKKHDKTNAQPRYISASTLILVSVGRTNGLHRYVRSVSSDSSRGSPCRPPLLCSNRATPPPTQFELGDSRTRRFMPLALPDNRRRFYQLSVRTTEGNAPPLTRLQVQQKTLLHRLKQPKTVPIAKKKQSYRTK